MVCTEIRIITKVSTVLPKISTEIQFFTKAFPMCPMSARGIQCLTKGISNAHNDFQRNANYY